MPRSANNPDGQNDLKGFVQITALLLPLALMWILWTSCPCYAEYLRKEQRRRPDDGPGDQEEEDYPEEEV